MKHDIFYQAMLARDYRFDGKFFVGVKTTGIYCRPICPARPKRENIEFFGTAAAAEKAGYRPCLRCRPESAPLSAAWAGKSALVQRALRAITSDGFFAKNEDRFADQFGVTARHLRRLFIEEIGLTPKQIAFNSRLGFARKLIVESNLPITSVAEIAGFNSLRRFNDAFKKRFHRAPRQLRVKSESVQSAEIELTLSYRPPLDWPHLLGFFRTHLLIGIETVSENSYARAFRIGKTIGHFRVSRPDGAKPVLNLSIAVDDPTVLFTVVQKVRQMFDLDSDPLLIANSFREDQALEKLWRKYPGLRVARGWDPFETGVATVLGQLVSTQQAQALVGQLIENYGEKVSHPSLAEPTFVFPSAKTLADSDLLAIKTTRARRAAIREFARLVAKGAIDLRVPQDPETIRQQLRAIPGIGPWSAEYIALRGLGETDAFPASDLILGRALRLYKNLDLETIRPWRSYAAVYLWRHHAADLKMKGRANETLQQNHKLTGRRTADGRKRPRTDGDPLGQ